MSAKQEWKNLGGIDMVSEVLEKGEIRTGNRYFITSLSDVKAFAGAMRGHWSIENSLFWVLDVAFHEDNCRIRKDNSGENFAVIHHIAVNLLKRDDAKMSMKAKRHRWAYSNSYLYKILFQHITF